MNLICKQGVPRVFCCESAGSSMQAAISQSKWQELTIKECLRNTTRTTITATTTATITATTTTKGNCKQGVPRAFCCESAGSSMQAAISQSKWQELTIRKCR